MSEEKFPENNKPDRVIVHMSDTPDTLKESKFSAKDIDKWHRDRGFRMIGYHYYIKRDGTIEPGRPESNQGAHTYGENQNSLGVCYEGKGLPTIYQIASFMELYRRFYASYEINYNNWFGHNEFSKKDCPGFSMTAMRNILRGTLLRQTQPIYSKKQT